MTDKFVLCVRVVDLVVGAPDQLCLKAASGAQKLFPSFNEGSADLRQNVFTVRRKHLLARYSQVGEECGSYLLGFSHQCQDPGFATGCASLQIPYGPPQ